MQRDQLNIEKEAEEYIQKKEAVKPPQKINKFKTLFFHFYGLYALIIIIIVLLILRGI